MTQMTLRFFYLFLSHSVAEFWLLIAQKVLMNFYNSSSDCNAAAHRRFILTRSLCSGCIYYCVWFEMFFVNKTFLCTEMIDDESRLKEDAVPTASPRPAEMTTTPPPDLPDPCEGNTSTPEPTQWLTSLRFTSGRITPPRRLLFSSNCMTQRALFFTHLLFLKYRSWTNFQWRTRCHKIQK